MQPALEGKCRNLGTCGIFFPDSGRHFVKSDINGACGGKRRCGVVKRGRRKQRDTRERSGQRGSVRKEKRIAGQKGEERVGEGVGGVLIE
eukprot:801179-Pleurochrysis_carterae.AAC.2